MLVDYLDFLASKNTLFDNKVHDNHLAKEINNNHINTKKMFTFGIL